MIRLTENARRVLEARYLRRDESGKVNETPDELFHRVAGAIAEADDELGGDRALWEERYVELLTSLDFLPNSPTLMNAGTSVGQLSACFVLPVEDSLEDIFEAVKQMALVQRTGGGTGFSFSELRPKNDIVRSTGGVASGPVSFMRIFDCATENIKQGGRRRGANLGVLRVDHPDILDFVSAKLEEGSFRNFNISVGITDAFFEAVRDDTSYALVHPATGEPAGHLRASAVFEAIVDAAWRSGDPGLLFLDAIHRGNPVPNLGRIEAANPCGEVPLLPYESCNLGSINLANMVEATEDGEAHIDWDKLAKTVTTAVRFLDGVIEVNRYPLPAIEKATRATRKIGLGVMGFAELLIRLGVGYAREEAERTGRAIMQFIAEKAREASAELADERGVFPAWDRSKYAPGNERLRHATRTAIAPTGTIGIIAGTSPSIEPLFALAYRRKHVLGEQTLVDMNAIARDYLDRTGYDVKDVLDAVLEKGTIAEVESVPATTRELLVTALEVPAERHLAIQAAFQQHVDNSVSKTVNLPESATRVDIARVYTRAWELGLKGVTVYRFGSKREQVIELGAEEKTEEYDSGSRCDPGECRV
jgi:ribonucleoside-diphosphate reductase alpha chain